MSSSSSIRTSSSSSGSSERNATKPVQPKRPSISSATPSRTSKHDELATEVTWTSVFQATCWVSPLYFSEMDGNYCVDPSSDQTSDVKTSSKQQREADEVLGWTLDAAARGVAVMGTAVFVSSELLRLAKEAAGCPVFDDDIVIQCDENLRVYGMRPTSILANIVTVVGLISAFVMPLVGSVIDHTPYRREIGYISAAAMATFTLVQMLVMQKHWFVASILQVFVAFSYTVHLCSVYAYLPELTSDHETMVQYTAQFSAAQYAGSVSFLVVTVAVLYTINRDNQFNPATLSQTVVVLVSCLFFGYAWTRLFRPRPASQKVPEHRTLLSAGFWKIYKTGQTIMSQHSAIKWFLFSAAFTEAATTTFSTIAITYMTDLLGFNAQENGIAILILLLFGVPGTRLAAWLTTCYNPIRSLQACLIVWIVNTTAAAYFLKGPNQQGLAYFFAMIWGLGIGWIYPSEKTLYVTIIPRGQEAELMGVYICACQILSWLPPMVFSIMNEMGVSMQIALFVLSLYFMISFGILFWMGDYDQAVLHAKAIDEGHRQFAISPAAGLGIDGYGCYEEWVEEDAADFDIKESGCAIVFD